MVQARGLGWLAVLYDTCRLLEKFTEKRLVCNVLSITESVKYCVLQCIENRLLTDKNSLVGESRATCAKDVAYIYGVIAASAVYTWMVQKPSPF